MVLARAIISDWGLFQTLLSKDDPSGGARGFHVPVIFSLTQSNRFRLCIAAVVDVIESLRLCSGIMRGDSSAIIAAYGDLCSALVSLLHVLYPNRKVNTFTDSAVMNFDVDSDPPSFKKLALPDVLENLLDVCFPNEDPSERNLFLKKYSVFLSSMVKDIQDVLWCCFDGGLKYFAIFSLPVPKPLAYEEVKNRFAALLNFLGVRNL